MHNSNPVIGRFHFLSRVLKNVLKNRNYKKEAKKGPVYYLVYLKLTDAKLSSKIRKKDAVVSEEH